MTTKIKDKTKEDIKTIDYTSIRTDIAKYWKQTANLKPHFYNDNQRILKILEVAGVDLDIVLLDVDNLYTLFPNKPIQSWTPTSNAIWVRLNCSQFLMRPHFKNVSSCLVIGPTAYAYLGNLGYVANPCWACYAMYKDEKPNEYHAYSSYSHNEGLHDNLPIADFELPQLVATVNCMFGYSPEGLPSVVLHSVSGYLNQKDAGALIRHFRLDLGLKVYSNIWSVGLSTQERATITSPPAPCLVRIKDKPKSIVFRSRDLPHPSGKIMESNLFLQDKLDSMQVALGSYLGSIEEPEVKFDSLIPSVEGFISLCPENLLNYSTFKPK